MSLVTKQFGTITESGGSTWVNKTNANDGNDATAATLAANNVADKLTFSVPGTVTGIISGVVLRVRMANGTNSTPGLAVLVKSGSTTLVDLTAAGTALNIAATTTNDYYINVPAPSAGEWSITDYNALTVAVNELLTAGTMSVYAVELLVFNFAYRWPIMSGLNTNLSASSARSTSPFASIDSAWSTSQALQTVLAPCDMSIRAEAGILATSPGGAGSETFKLVDPSAINWGASNGAQSQFVGFEVDATISGASVTFADDGKTPFPMKAGFQVRLDRTLSGSISNAAATQQLRQYVYADKFPCIARTAGLVGAGGTAYIGLQDTSATATTNTARGSVIPVAGTLANLYVAGISGGAPNANGYTVTLEKSTDGGGTWSATALTATLANSNAVVSDTSHSVSVNAGDMVHWKVLGNGAGVSTALAVSCTFVATSDPSVGLLTCPNFGAQGSTTSFNNWYGGGAWDATEANANALGGICEIIALAVQLSAVPGAGKSRAITLRKNNANTTATVTLSGGVGSATAATWSGSIVLTESDSTCVTQVPSSSPNSSIVYYGLAYRSVEYAATKTDNEGITDTGITRPATFNRGHGSSGTTPADEAMSIKDNWPITARGFTSTSATSTTITVTGAGWTTNQWAGKYIALESGPDANDVRLIVSNTATTITVAAFSVSPTAGGGDLFAILDHIGDSRYFTGASAPVNYAQTLGSTVTVTDVAHINPRRLRDVVGMTDSGVAVRRKKGDVLGMTDPSPAIAIGGVAPRANQSQVLIY